MKRTLVVSDIHGELDLFEELLQKVKYDPANDQLILLGDYVDRGPDAKGVLNRVMDLKKNGAVVLRGNHDDMMLAAVDDEPEAWERWERGGGLQTIQSYDPQIKSMELPTNEIFKEHVDFIRDLDYYFETQDYIFVHAGVDPQTAIQDTDPVTLVWIRREFYEAYKGEKTVIFGHTPTTLLHGKKIHDVYFGNNNIIGIDGAATYGGQLNCLELSGTEGSRLITFTAVSKQ